MQKINTPDSLFHDGDPSSGALGTIVTAAWLNTMQGELANVIEAAGIKLDAAKTDQLKQAISKLVSDAAAPLKHGHAWADISKTPTTLAGYGITDALPLKPLLGAKVDLDGIISTGWYHQSLNINAASGSNYPTPTAGMLSVYASDTMVYQLYQDFQGKRLWWRVQYNGTWSAWQASATMSDKQPGTLITTFANTPPAGALVCNGAALSRQSYAALFSAIGTRYGAGDGAKTFNLPNVPDGFALLAGNAGNVGELNAGTLISHTHSAWTDQQGNHSHAINDPGHTHSFEFMPMNGTQKGGGSYAVGLGATQSTNKIGTGVWLNDAGLHGHNIGIGASGGDANRAAGIKLLICITY